jgi:hypothetical protein
MSKDPKLAAEKEKILLRIQAESVVFKREGGTGVMVVGKKLLDEKPEDYLPNHKPWVTQLLENGWVLTDEDPRNYVEVRCWWGTEGSGWDKKDVIKYSITHLNSEDVCQQQNERR